MQERAEYARFFAGSLTNANFLGTIPVFLITNQTLPKRRRALLATAVEFVTNGRHQRFSGLI